MPEGDWFGSPYYDLLYCHRDENEASGFLEKVLSFLHLPNKANIWDMACGNGRHADFLARKGYSVIATDLSFKRIQNIISRDNELAIRFAVHDYKKNFYVNYFDAVFNLFTSLGYSPDKNELYRIFHRVQLSLKSGGFFILDFLNPEFVKKNLVPQEELEKEGVVFMIQRGIESDPEAVVKNIEVFHQAQRFLFREWVRLYTHQDFEQMALAHGFQILYCWGDYELSAFQRDLSPRMIFVFRKK